MTARQMTHGDDRWLLSAEDNPAGPLYSGGKFAEADIVGEGGRKTQVSVCSGSHTVQCC
ncbi:MAG TPA: DUF6229 family protein [Allosphingosinicella sp.]|nr:DUF6229 family protein [Allosphingosinicella sp.]